MHVTTIAVFIITVTTILTIFDSQGQVLARCVKPQSPVHGEQQRWQAGRHGARAAPPAADVRLVPPQQVESGVGFPSCSHLLTQLHIRHTASVSSQQGMSEDTTVVLCAVRGRGGALLGGPGRGSFVGQRGGHLGWRVWGTIRKRHQF